MSDQGSDDSVAAAIITAAVIKKMVLPPDADVSREAAIIFRRLTRVLKTTDEVNEKSLARRKERRQSAAPKAG